MSAAPNWLDIYFGPPTLSDESASLPVRSLLNFTGGGVVATDDPTNKRTNISIPGISLGGDGNGFAQITAANGIVVTTSKGKDIDFWFAATTPDATQATFFTYTPAASSVARVISVDGIITLFNGGVGYAKYKLDGLYTMSSGNVLTKRSTTPNDVITGPESSSSTDVILGLSGTVASIVQGKGFSSNNSWTGRIFIHEAAF